ncbi:MAG TPA: hypothetical protein VD766_05760 [Solirubrobacterales bacterium]|nr:hypothetical protein [Solirubrobacterales bacterium]
MALPASAGMAPDPRPGDTLLGKSGGVAYVSDPDFAAMATSTETGAACPDTPGKWRIVGGGFSLVGGADASQRVASSAPADLLDLYGDDDLKRDDFWRIAAVVSVGTTVTSYAICTKWSGLKQKEVTVPDSDSGERSHVAKCGPGKKVSGGGGGISTSDSYVSSMFPKNKSRRWKFSAYDSIGGIGGMHNYVVCARDRDFQIVKDEVSVPAGASSVLFAAECFPGQSVVGGGAKSSGAPGTLSLRASQPYDSSDPDAIPSNGWEARAFSTDPGSQTLRVYAICHG